MNGYQFLLRIFGDMFDITSLSLYVDLILCVMYQSMHYWDLFALISK